MHQERSSEVGGVAHEALVIPLAYAASGVPDSPKHPCPALPHVHALGNAKCNHGGQE